MIVHKDFNNLDIIKNAVVTSGTFDGVHIGHQMIIKRLNEIAAKINGESVLITFWPHPRLVLGTDNDIKLISTLEEKAHLLDRFGIDHLIVIPFDKAFASLSSQEFVENILVNKIRTKKLVIGYDHKFGRNREGSFDYLQKNCHKYGFEVEEIPKQEVSNMGVSSSKIRHCLQEGDVQTANDYLGHNFSLEGHIIEGKKIGRTIGFPTANIEISYKSKLIPTGGVYAVKVFIKNQVYNGMMNIGTRPTIDSSMNQTIEVNIFDFQEDIYDLYIKVECIQRIRNELKFNDLNELATEISKDKEKSLLILK